MSEMLVVNFGRRLAWATALGSCGAAQYSGYKIQLRSTAAVHPSTEMLNIKQINRPAYLMKRALEAPLYKPVLDHMPLIWRNSIVKD